MIKHTPTMGRDNPLKYIKINHPDGIYVQMYREGISISKLFPKSTPIKKVVAYRDKMVADNALYFYRKKQANVLDRNKDLPVGVCITFAKSKNGETFVVSVMVSYVSDNGTRKTKGFYVGTVGHFPEDKLEHAVLMGCAYREDYEYCVRQQLAFDGANDYYKGWLDKYFFDLTCESRVSHYE